jgi:hypothetical protein
MEYSALEDCMKRGEDAEGDLLWTAVDYGGWQAGRVGCIKREGFEEGIPAWLVSPFRDVWRLLSLPVSLLAAERAETHNLSSLN